MLSKLGDELDEKLTKLVKDTNAKVVNKIATKCDQTELEVKDLNLFTESNFKDLKLHIEQLKSNIADCLPMSTLHKINKQLSMTTE